MNHLPDSWVLYLSRHEIDTIIQSVAERINRDYQNKKVILIGVLKGAVLFISDLIRHLTIPADVEFVRLSSYGKAKTSSGTVTLIQDIQADIFNQHVLIVEEIIDSGRTLQFLHQRLLVAKPASLEIVTLLDKASQRLMPVPVKYIGHTIQNQFLIGYGLDLEERERNLPDIYYVNTNS